jgi:hypothetical protein
VGSYTSHYPSARHVSDSNIIVGVTVSPLFFATYFLRSRDGVEDDAITLTPQTPSIEEEIGEEIDR